MPDTARSRWVPLVLHSQKIHIATHGREYPTGGQWPELCCPLAEWSPNQWPVGYRLLSDTVSAWPRCVHWSGCTVVLTIYHHICRLYYIENCVDIFMKCEMIVLNQRKFIALVLLMWSVNIHIHVVVDVLYGITDSYADWTVFSHAQRPLKVHLYDTDYDELII